MFAISVNGDAARRDMWAGRVERCLVADMTVKVRCTLNKVAESSLYKWMACIVVSDTYARGTNHLECKTTATKGRRHGQSSRQIHRRVQA